jgi:hypothetical protein
MVFEERSAPGGAAVSPQRPSAVSASRDTLAIYGLQLPLLERSSFLRGLFGARRDCTAQVTSQPQTNSAAYDAMCEKCSDLKWLEHHGPAYSVLKMQSDFIKPPFQQVHAVPKREFIASNYKPDGSTEELYYVNGMRCGPQDVERHLSSLVKTFGKPITAIINDQECDPGESKRPGFFRSLWHGICGFLSAQAGYDVEPEAVGRVERAIREHVQTGKPLHLIAHSQGGIIVANALQRILGSDSHLSVQEKERVRSLVEVSTFGAAEHYFPRGIRVQEYAHHGDAVASVTSLLADAREWVRGVFRPLVSRFGGRALLGGREVPLERAPVVYLEGSHDFGPFLDKIPAFFIEKVGGGPPIDGACVALELKESIVEGRLSDVMHGLIIKEMIRREDATFARTFLGACPTGVVGACSIPFLGELRTLARR